MTEPRTILIVSHDLYLRRRTEELLREHVPKAKLLQYTLAGSVLGAMRSLSLDMLIMSEALLDSDSELFAKAARRQMPLLPIITLVADPSGAPSLLHRFVSIHSLDRQLIPAVCGLFHYDILAQSAQEA